MHLTSVHASHFQFIMFSFRKMWTTWEPQYSKWKCHEVALTIAFFIFFSLAQNSLQTTRKLYASFVHCNGNFILILFLHNQWTSLSYGFYLPLSALRHNLPQVSSLSNLDWKKKLLITAIWLPFMTIILLTFQSHFFYVIHERASEGKNWIINKSRRRPSLNMSVVKQNIISSPYTIS